MYEVLYATTRVARIAAADSDSAKRRFAAYVLYDETDHVVSDVQLSFGDDAEVTPFGDAPVAGSPTCGPGWPAATRSPNPSRSIVSRIPSVRLMHTCGCWRPTIHGVSKDTAASAAH